jgi:hypothetical protein
MHWHGTYRSQNQKQSAVKGLAIIRKNYVPRELSVFERWLKIHYNLGLGKR